MNHPTVTPPPQQILLQEINQLAAAASTAENTAMTTSGGVVVKQRSTEKLEEEVPVKRAVRMVVGLSESSLNSPPSEDVSADNSTTVSPTMEPPMKWRQESATSTSTASTERMSFQSEEHEASERSSSIGADNTAKMQVDMMIQEGKMQVDMMIQEGREVVVMPEAAVLQSKTSAEMDADADDLSGSGIFSLQKLYGREQEEETLAATYDRIMQQRVPRTQLEYVLISGGVGSGKTALSDSLRRKVKSEGGYFCVGAFDQMMQRGPVQPLVDSFAEYVQQVFDYGEEEVKIVRNRVLSIVDATDLPSLMRIVPALQTLIKGEREGGDLIDNAYRSAKDCGCSGEKNDVGKRTYSDFAMMRLMRAISRPERPVVMMLDDLQWAGGCAFEKLRAIVMDNMNESFMFLGITRNDVSPKSEVAKFLRHVEDHSVNITNIELSNLPKEVIQEMVIDSFAMPTEQSTSLAEFVYDVSSGNPFFAASSITMMQHQPGFLNYDAATNKWCVNPKVADPYLSCCPVDLVAKKLQVYPREQQKVLMVVACLGSHSTKNMIEAALQEDAADSLEKLVAKGKLKYCEMDNTYTISFNAIKTAAYNLIGEELRPAFHLEIGLRLMKYLEPQELDEKLFCVAMQLQKGLALIPDQEQKYEVAALFVRTAEKTAETFSFNATLWALRIAYDLLGPNHWEEAYELSVAVYNYLAEMEFALDDSERVDKLLDEINQHGKVCYDKLQAYTTRVHVLGVRGQHDAAIDKAVSILQCIGVNLHTDRRRMNLIWSMAKTCRKVRGKSNEMLRRLPEMSDPKLLTAMQLLNLLFLNTFLHRRELFPFVVLKMVKLSLKHGLSAMSSVGFAGYGALMTFCGQGEEAQRFGQLALALVDRFDANSFRSRVYGFVYGVIQPAVKPWRESLDKLNEGHELGMMTGDVEFGEFCAHLHVGFMMDDGGFKVEEMLAAIRSCADLSKGKGTATNVDLSAMEPLYLAFQEYNNPNGNLSDDMEFLKIACQEAVASGNAMNICMVHYTRIYGLFSVRKYEEALKVLDEKHAHQPPMGASIMDSFEFYMDGLVVFACARHEKNKMTRKSLIQRGKKAMKMLQKMSVQNPDNCLGKFTLLEAEYAALCKKESVAKVKYSQAMAVAAGNHNYFETIFSKQAAGVHYVLDLQDPMSGLKYLEESIDVLKEFGGHAAATYWSGVVRDLKDRRRSSAFLG